MEMPLVNNFLQGTYSPAAINPDLLQTFISIFPQIFHLRGSQRSHPRLAQQAKWSQSCEIFHIKNH